MERRENPRYEVQHRVCANIFPKCHGDSQRQVFFCNTNDLSVGGLQLSGQTSFEEGQLLELLVICGSAYKGFEFTGRVAWVEQDDQEETACAGIEFVGTPEPTRIAWREILDQMLAAALLGLCGGSSLTQNRSIYGTKHIERHS